VKIKPLTVPVLALGIALLANAQGSATPGKVGIIHIQNAILSTKDGQKAASELQGRFAPKKAELDKKQNDIAQKRDQLNKGSNAMSEEAKQNLMRDIDQKTKALNRDTEDAQAELDQEQGKIMQELGQRIMAVIDKYAKDNGFSLILDVSSPQTPVLYAANNIDVTNDIIALYDKNAPAAGSPAPATSAAPPASGKPAVPPAVTNRPITPPPAKKTPAPGTVK
jgi:outer membrane protein